MVQNREMELAAVNIRRMKYEDVERAAEVEAVCFSLPWSAKAIAESLQSDRSFYLVAEYEGEIVGQCGVHAVCGEGEITNVAVLPKFREWGIGSLLLEQLLEQGSRQGIDEFTLEVRAGNQAAIRLYEKYGFQVEGVRKNFYEKPREDAMIMWKRQAMHGTITT